MCRPRRGCSLKNGAAAESVFCFPAARKRRSGLWRREEWNATERIGNSLRMKAQLLPLVKVVVEEEKGFKGSEMAFCGDNSQNTRKIVVLWSGQKNHEL